MAAELDDLDDLLAELEGSGVSKECKSGGVRISQQSSPSIDNLDALLADVTCDDNDSPVPRVRPAASAALASSAALPSSSSKRSGPTVLGGGTCAVGPCGSLARKVASDRLRCLSCDFVVSRWPGYRWADGVDYLFFRNHAGVDERMEQQLRRSPQHAAYACQCSWASVSGVQALAVGDEVEGRALKWVAR